MPTDTRKSRRARSEVAHGTVFLVGGKDGRNDDRSLINRFVRLCGAERARIVVITSASDTPDRHQREYAHAFHDQVVADVSVFHTENREQVDDPALLAAVAQAHGVYFSGGGQRKLIGVMGGTRFEECLHERFRAGLHVGGTSAGASAMSKVMIAGDGRNGGSADLATGFGLLPSVIVDQHFQQRERLSRLIGAVLLHPTLVGFGIDEETAIEIDPSGTGMVLGPGTVTVVDGLEIDRSDPEEGDQPVAFAGMRLHVLAEGWSYDITHRKVLPRWRSS